MRKCEGYIRYVPFGSEVCEGIPGFGYPDCYEPEKDDPNEPEWDEERHKYR